MRNARSIAIAAILGGASTTFGAFTPGTISLVQVGDGTLPFAGNVAQSVSIVSYDMSSGSAVGSVSLGGFALTSKNDDADGHLNFSGNGQYLTLGGYVAAPGDAYPVTTTAPRAIARVDSSGNVSVGSFSSIYAGQTINAVASVDGNAFFTVGGGPDSNSAGGLYYMPALLGMAPVNVSQHQFGSTADSYRNARIIDGKLYINTASQGAFTNRGSYIMTINGGLPIANVNTASTATPVIVNTEGSLVDASGNVSPDTTGKLYPKTDVAYIDTNHDGTFDTAYSTGGKEDLEKWVLTNSKWLRTDTIDAPGITFAGQNNEINAIDYTMTDTGIELFLANDFGIWKFTDTGGTGAFASSDIASSVDSNGRRYLTTNYFISAGTNEQFRGLAVAAVPEPAGAVLLVLASGLLARRRRNA